MGSGVLVGAGVLEGSGVLVGSGDAVGAGAAVGSGDAVGAGAAVGSGDAVGAGALVGSSSEEGGSLEAQPTASTTAAAMATTSRSEDCLLRRGFRGAMVAELAIIISSIP